ncbi:MAG: DNRLRE domain-containing protein [Sporichthyaceae bacterium]
MTWSGSRKSLGMAPARRRLTRSVAAMTAAGLFATLAVQAPAGANQTPTAPDSEVAATQASSSVDPAAVQARESGERVEITVERGADSTTFINPDGTTTVEITEEPTRLQLDGRWVEIDPSLAPEDGVLVPAATEADVKISDGRGDGTGEALATVVEGNKSLSLDWPTDLPAAQVAGGEATFDAGRTRDVQVSATNGGFNVHVILDKAPVTQPVYRLPITARGVSLSKTDSGSFVAKDASGVPVFWIARPVMWDATQEGLEAGPEQVVDVDATLDSDGDGRQVLVLRPSMEFLSDPSTVYPVRVDPDVYTDSSADRTTYVTTLDPLKGFPTASYLRVGYTDTLMRNRTYIHHEIPDRPGTVIDAKLRLYQYDTRSCTPSTLHIYPVAEKWRATDHDELTGPEAGVWWKTPDPTSSALKHRQPEINTSSAYASSKAFAHGMSGCGNASEDINVTKIVRAWDEDVLANNGLALRANDTNDAAYKAFCSKNVNPSGTACNTTSRVPTLIVTYNTAPSTVTGLSMSPPVSCLSGTTRTQISTTTPTLRGTAEDADIVDGADSTKLRVEIWPVAGTAPIHTGY